MRAYGTELFETNYPISFHRGPETWMVPFCWHLGTRWSRWRNLVEIGNGHTNNIKIAVANANLCGKIYDMCTLLKYTKKCGNKWNMRQSQIHIKLTCILYTLLASFNMFSVKRIKWRRQTFFHDCWQEFVIYMVVQKVVSTDSWPQLYQIWTD